MIVDASLFPVLWLLSMSLKTPATVSDRSLIPKDVDLRQLHDAVRRAAFDSPLLQPLINSIVIALIATAIAIVLASFTAYAIARLEFPGKAAHPRRRAGDRDVPADLGRSGRCSTCGARSGSTTRTSA